jgi:uncharacterized membrane protein
VGLALNFTPWGVRLAPIMIALALFAEITAAVAVVRKFKYFQLNHR